MFQATCTNEQKILVTVSYVTAAGNPAVVDGPTTVEVVSGDGTVVTVGDHQFYIVSGTLAGPTIYAMTADADLGAGVQTITDSITLEVTSAQASAFGVVFGTPEPK